MDHHLRSRSWMSPLLAGLAIALAVVLAAWVLAGCSSGSTARGASPAPTTRSPASTTTTTPNRNGPFAVGFRTLTFVDSSRETPANGSVSAHPTRTLETIIAYPAPGTPDPDKDVEGAAPVAGQFPMIVYAHGFGGGLGSPYLHYWAQAGFVAVAPSFPLTRQDAPGGPSYVDTQNEPGDISFVISQMLHLPAPDADLQRIIDAKAIGVMGASLGATVALNVGYNSRYQDARIEAVVAVAGGCPACPAGVEDPNDTFFTGPSVPLMLIHGTADPFAPYQSSVEEFAKAPDPKFFVTLVGAKHIRFDQPWETIAARSMIDFFDQYLKHDTGAPRQLTTDANVPGTASLQQSAG